MKSVASLIGDVESCAERIPTAVLHRLVQRKETRTLTFGSSYYIYSKSDTTHTYSKYDSYTDTVSEYHVVKSVSFEHAGFVDNRIYYWVNDSDNFRTYFYEVRVDESGKPDPQILMYEQLRDYHVTTHGEDLAILWDKSFVMYNTMTKQFREWVIDGGVKLHKSSGVLLIECETYRILILPDYSRRLIKNTHKVDISATSYSVRDDKLLTVYDIKTGDVIWKRQQESTVTYTLVDDFVIAMAPCSGGRNIYKLTKNGVIDLWSTVRSQLYIYGRRLFACMSNPQISMDLVTCKETNYTYNAIDVKNNMPPFAWLGNKRYVFNFDAFEPIKGPYHDSTLALCQIPHSAPMIDEIEAVIKVYVPEWFDNHAVLTTVASYL